MLVRLLALLFALAMPFAATAAEQLQLTGEVTYRERVALPDGARLRVSLVALPGGQTVVSATAAVDGQVPLDFVLDVQSRVLAAGGAYGLVAEITTPGALTFRNAVPVPVDLSAPTPATILVQSVAASPRPPSPAPSDPGPDSPLFETTWTVTSIGGDPVLPSTELTLVFEADLRVGGHGGCNNYFAEADYAEAPLAFGPIAGTRMACEAEVMAQESRYFNALAATRGYRLEGTTLHLLDAAGLPLVGLVSAP